MNLEERTMNALDWPFVLERLASHARTAAGARAAGGLALCDSREEALRCYGAVRELQRVDDGGDGLPLAGLLDVGAAVERAGRGEVLDPPVLRDLAQTMTEIRRLRRWLRQRGDDCPVLESLGRDVDVDPALVALFETAFDETGGLADAAWPHLADLRRASRETRRRVVDVLEGLVKGDALGDALQDRYVTDRGGRLVIPVRSGRRGGLGIVHDTSASGETVFLEPLQVVEHQNRLRELEQEVRREERRIMAVLSAEVGAHESALQEALAGVEALDLASARMRLGRELGGQVPHVGMDGVLSLEEARHPILHLRGVPVVPNRLEVGPGAPGLVLTGPNAGGKTVALKTMGLLALLVRAGIPVPAAPGSRADFFPLVLADVGDMQTVEQDLSTFSGRLTVIREMLRRAGPGALLLLDEVAVGTDPAQGSALARAALEAMVEAGARVVVTTHYGELKALPSGDPRFRLAGAEYRGGLPTFRMTPGVAGQSHALKVARHLGLSEAVLARAEELLGSSGRDLARLMDDLERRLQEVDQRGATLAEREIALRCEESRVEAETSRLARRRAGLEREVAEGFSRRIEAWEDEVRGMVAALQASPDLARAGLTLREIRRVRGAAEPAPEPAPPPPAVVRIGDELMVPALGRAGVVREVAGDRVKVQLGNVTSWVERGELAARGDGPADSGKGRKRPPPPPAREPKEEGAPAVVRCSGNTCDLRGLRLEEALEALERFLDDLLLRGERVAFVLHGHGTGVLKTGVRGWLPGSPYVSRWRPAGEQEGGDAFTVAFLR